MVNHWQTGLFTYASTVIVGGQLYVIALWVMDPTLNAAVQLYAQVALALALAVGLWSVFATWSSKTEYSRVGSVLLGAAGGATTVYLLVGAVELFSYSDYYLLPVVRLVAQRLALV